MHFSDLLELPYRLGGRDPATGIDCRWTARRALERIFPDFAPVELPESPEEEEAMLAAIDNGSSRWRVIGSNVAVATQLGDLIHMQTEDGRGGLAVVIDKVGRIAITAMPGRGSCALPLRKFDAIHAVLRRAP